MSEQQCFFEALCDPMQRIPAGLTTWNGSDPSVRFAVYRNNVIVSLINALADTYPIAQQLVGEEFFRAMARLFVGAEPPNSRVLTFYGASFPDFIEHFPPAASVPYLADVARLEMFRVHAYHAADCNGVSPDVIVQALKDIDRLPHLLVGFHPSFCLLNSPYAVVSLWAAHQGIADITTVDPYVAESTFILRPGLDVEVIRITAGAGNFIEHLLHGATLGSAVDQTRLTHADFDLSHVLSLLIQTKAIAYLTTSIKKQA